MALLEQLYNKKMEFYMDVIIKETGRAQVLFIPDTEGNDCALAVIEETSGTERWGKNSADIWIVEQAEYDWWSKIANETSEGLACLQNHKKMMACDLYKLFWHVETIDIQHFSQVDQDTFERITSGRLSAEVKGVKDNRGIRIVKNAQVTNKTSCDGIHSITCECTFNLYTKRMRYQMPISVIGTYRKGQKAVILRELDSPIHLSNAQKKVAYAALFTDIKIELLKDGFSGIKDFVLAGE